MTKSVLKVSCAIILKGTKFLAAQRNANQDHPLHWEFPGGKLKNGESAPDSIVREIKEELEIIVSPTQQLEAIYHDYGNKQIELIPFICPAYQGDIVVHEHAKIKWVTLDQASTLQWAEADLKIIEQLRQKGLVP
ncbi:(deoxy)nucleoside triphosphate pyrophosphohydrolase [Puteibacter caeruleilacunae]|nr:(deoxy)nucleoside triphosphate pyrophosphohydrolase [Puteibacter caeruleilacunae]